MSNFTLRLPPTSPSGLITSWLDSMTTAPRRREVDRSPWLVPGRDHHWRGWLGRCVSRTSCSGPSCFADKARECFAEFPCHAMSVSIWVKEECVALRLSRRAIGFADPSSSTRISQRQVPRDLRPGVDPRKPEALYPASPLPHFLSIDSRAIDSRSSDPRLRTLVDGRRYPSSLDMVYVHGLPHGPGCSDGMRKATHKPRNHLYLSLRSRIDRS